MSSANRFEVTSRRTVGRVAEAPLILQLRPKEKVEKKPQNGCVVHLQKQVHDTELEPCATSGIINSRSPPSASSAGTALKHPPLFHKRISAADRFIGSRSKYSVDAANYLLTKQPAKEEKNYELDVIKEMAMLHVKWRKDLMHSAMVKENVIPGLGQKKVLRQNLLPTTESKEMWMTDCYKEGMWKSRPRKMPLITSAATVLDMPPIDRYTILPHNRIDWSSKNIFVEALHDKLTVFNITSPQLAKQMKNQRSENVCAVKWNNAGDQLVTCTFSSKIILYDMDVNKVLWVNRCNKEWVGGFPASNFVRCLCWSPDDKFLAVGCIQIVTVYRVRTGHEVSSVIAHSEKVVALVISSNSRYIASTSVDKTVRIFTWPELQPVFDIVYNYPANGLAWNPMNGNMLSIGGGLSDASLSIWDMTTKDVISYRVVDFFGSINHLAWNKISGELVVQWTCIDEENEFTIMPVLSSLDRVVDEIPMAKTSRVHAVMWNVDHSQIAVYNEEGLSIWNFFGDEYQYRQTHKKDSKKNTRHTNFSSIHHTIR
ncbi:protein cortex [Lasioglossum baleicum]|uniref:protein cortex n=1 Tax=Lasioglossum baleicum TaxID=434251 RepID=UPI003FCC8D60